MSKEQSTGGGSGAPSPNGPHERWIAIGRKYDPKHPNHPTPMQPIPVMEMARSVSMDNDIDPETKRKEPYGQPIDAPLAGNLMSNLLNSLKRYGIMKALLKYDEYLEQLNEATKFTKNADAAKTENFAAVKAQKEAATGAAMKAVVEAADKIHHETGMRWLVQLLVKSHAITFDKSALLKIISQPKCEGVRFYLCLRPHKPKAVIEELHLKVDPYDLPDGVLSLVLVGVDADGNDLNYPPVVDKNSQKPDLATLNTTSALDEYGHPPGGGIVLGPKTPEGPAYTLWNYIIKNVLADNFQ